MHRIFQVQDGLRQIHRLSPILFERVQIDEEIERGKFGTDDDLKSTVSAYELELYETRLSDREYLPTFTAFQVLGVKLQSFSPEIEKSEEDTWSSNFFRLLKSLSVSVSVPTSEFIRGDIDLEEFWASTRTMQQLFTDLLRFVYDWNTERRDSPLKMMIQDSAEWTELCGYCVWILTQVYCEDCIALYTDFMAQRLTLNEELQAMVVQIGLHKAGKESTISSPATPSTASRGRKASRHMSGESDTLHASDMSTLLMKLKNIR